MVNPNREVFQFAHNSISGCDIYGYIYMVNPDREVFQFAHAVDYLMIGDETDASGIVCQTFVSGLIDPLITIGPPSDNGYCGKVSNLLCLSLVMNQPVQYSSRGKCIVREPTRTNLNADNYFGPRRWVEVHPSP